MATVPTAEFYSELGLQYESAFGHDGGLLEFVNAALKRLPPHASVLDIGCGTGKPVSSTLAAAGNQVYGIDISQAMIDLSRTQVPLGTFEVVNMLEKAGFEIVLTQKDLFAPPSNAESAEELHYFITARKGSK